MMTAVDTRFVEIYEAHYRQVHAYCRRRAFVDAVDDAVAETFLVVWRKIDEVPAQPDTLPWLFGVAYRVLDASLHEMTDFNGEWYGLGVMDYARASGVFNGLAIGHQGLSSVTTCCSAVALVALPDQGIIIAVQADTTPTYGGANPQVDRLAKALGEAAMG